MTARILREAKPPAKGQRLVYDDHRDASTGFVVGLTLPTRKAFALRYYFEGRDNVTALGNKRDRKLRLWTLHDQGRPRGTALASLVALAAARGDGGRALHGESASAVPLATRRWYNRGRSSGQKFRKIKHLQR